MTAITRLRRNGAVALACALLGLATQAAAATDAGTRIVNVAGLRFEGAPDAPLNSNAVSLTVDEVLDVAIATPAGQIAASAAALDVPVPFIVSNLGNAAETFVLDVRAESAEATIALLAADTNDDGIYDPAVDQPLAGSELPLASGQSRRLFAMVHAAPGEPTTVTATATAATGHGEPGSVYPGAGADASDAIVGRTGASAAASMQITAAAEAPSLAKSQSVRAPDGSDRVMPGSIVTYTLDARFPGSTAAVEIADAIPAGTRFVPGSITIDGRPASDAADDDLATFDGAAVRVVLGDVAAASSRSIQFAVNIL